MNLPPAMTPDPMPLREALRGLRHMLRLGGQTLRETVTVETLPRPASDFAGAVLREVDALAREADDMASRLAAKVLGGAAPAHASLSGLAARPDAEAAFAAAVYAALKAALRRLKAGEAIFVSEAAARAAFAAAAPGATGPEAAAGLTLALIEARVMRGAPPDGPRVAAADLPLVAAFAVMLWLQSERAESEDEAALDAAVDLAVALAPDLSAAIAQRDAARLAALYAEFASHV